MKGCFSVTGLPDGIPFRKPSSYGIDQVNAIMKCQESIVFHIEPRDDSLSTSNDDRVLEKVLRKILDDELVVEVASGERLIEESDLETQEVDLNESEFNLLMQNKARYFSDDAWISLRGNHASCNNHIGYILSTYTLSDDDAYWLFYHPCKISDIKELDGKEKISGYRLNKTNEKLKFKLLVSKKKVSVNAMSIVCNDPQEDAVLVAIRIRVGRYFLCKA